MLHHGISAERQASANGAYASTVAGREDGGDRAALEACLAGEALRTVFQPILDLRHGRIYGYEALTRGPSGSRFESPVGLFRLARQHGHSHEMELVAVRCAVERFAALGAAGKLFVNFSPLVLAERREDPEDLVALLRAHGMAPKQLVIELTENDGALLDSKTAWSELLRCRDLGFGIAIDDLGEGFSSLRLWSELRPEYVKVDKHFIQSIHGNPIKLQMVRAMQQIAQVSGASVIAEGIELEADFQTVRDLGIRHGQGFLIGHPAASAQGDAVEVWSRLSAGPVLAFPVPGRSVNRVSARKLMRPIAPVAPQTENDVVFGRFETDPELQMIPVVDGRKPVGIVNRHSLLDRFARPYRREIFGKRPCSMLMNADPVLVDADTSIQELSFLVADSGQRAMLDGFIVVEDGEYAGIGNAQDLIREMTELQIAAARYANPLTLLPGNVPIAEHIERLLSRGCRFVACYCDLNDFKPFNDVFGYQHGDEAIRLTASVLADACDPGIDFVGHIGGDDFVLVLQSEDWEARCRAILSSFESRVAALFSEEDRLRGHFVAEDRQGQLRNFPLLTLSIGAVAADTGTFGSHSEAAAAASEAKRMAKRARGNVLFVERRRQPAASFKRPEGSP